MKKQTPTISRLIILVIQIALLVGCAPRLVKLDPVLSQNAIPPRLPVTVGYYFSPETTKYEYVQTTAAAKRIGLETGVNQIYPIGKASVELFIEAYSKLFEHTEPVQQIPIVLPTGASPLAAIIQIDFEELYRPLGYAAEIKYRCKLYSPDGKRLIASWPFYGRANTGKSWYFVPGRIQSLAMKDAAEQFITNFRRYPGVESWLRQVAITDDVAVGMPPKKQAATIDQQIINMPIVYQTNEYVVAADPFDVGRRNELLGSEPVSNEILPVRIAVLNKGNKAIWVQRDGFASSYKSNIQAKAPATPSSSFAHMTLAPGAVGTGAGILTTIEALVMAPGYFRKYDDWRQRTESIFQSLLTDTLLCPGESTQGIIYLPLPRGESADNYVIELRLISAAGGSVLSAHLPLTSQAIEGSKDKSKDLIRKQEQKEH